MCPARGCKLGKTRKANRRRLQDRRLASDHRARAHAPARQQRPGIDGSPAGVLTQGLLRLKSPCVSCRHVRMMDRGTCRRRWAADGRSIVLAPRLAGGGACMLGTGWALPCAALTGPCEGARGWFLRRGAASPPPSPSQRSASASPRRCRRGELERRWRVPSPLPCQVRPRGLMCVCVCVWGNETAPASGAVTPAKQRASRRRGSAPPAWAAAPPESRARARARRRRCASAATRQAHAPAAGRGRTPRPRSGQGPRRQTEEGLPRVYVHARNLKDSSGESAAGSSAAPCTRWAGASGGLRGVRVSAGGGGQGISESSTTRTAHSADRTGQAGPMVAGSRTLLQR